MFSSADIKYRLLVGKLFDALKAQNAPEVENVLYEIKSEISPDKIPEEDKSLYEKARSLLDRMKDKRRTII